MGAGLFEWKTEKIRFLVSVFPLKWEIVPVFPAHLRMNDSFAFSRNP